MEVFCQASEIVLLQLLKHLTIEIVEYEPCILVPVLWSILPALGQGGITVKLSSNSHAPFRLVRLPISSLCDVGNFFHERCYSLLSHIKHYLSGTVPSHTEVQQLASVELFPVKAAEYQKYLKTLWSSLQKYRSHNLAAHQIVSCNMNTFLNFYIIPKHTRQLASEILYNAYGTFDACLKSNNMVNALLFLETKPEGPLSTKQLFDMPNVENWLQRNILHIVAIFVHDKQILQLVPKDIVKSYIDTKDLHGCTPLHVAYMHHNDAAINFLRSCTENKDSVDYFGFKPKSLGSLMKMPVGGITLEAQEYFEDTEEHQVDSKHHGLCVEVLKASSNILENMKPMLILPQEEAEIQSKELKNFFERLTKNTEYCDIVEKVVIAGSLREKLKVGRLDEADVQIWFKQRATHTSSINDNLIKGLKNMNFEGVHLRPVCTTNPWEFLWEKPGPSEGITISVDIVPVFKDVTPDYTSLAKHSQILKSGNLHKVIYFLKLKRVEEGFCQTYFAYEWDILDRISIGCRLGILIAKTLLQAYYWSTKMEQSPLKKPITSYVVKTAVFHILASVKNQNEALDESEMLGHCEYYQGESTSTVTDTEDLEKATLDSSVKWLDEEDLQEHSEKGRVWARKIFETIKVRCLENRMTYFWRQDMFLVRKDKITDVIAICNHMLERLQPEKFY